jgi:hypothetical protein
MIIELPACSGNSGYGDVIDESPTVTASEKQAIAIASRGQEKDKIQSFGIGPPFELRALLGREVDTENSINAGPGCVTTKIF